LAYPLTDEALYRGTGRGVSNVVESLPARIIVREGIVAVVHATGSSENAP
jgi:thiamine pyrophosphokinase